MISNVGRTSTATSAQRQYVMLKRFSVINYILAKCQFIQKSVFINKEVARMNLLLN